MTSGTGTREWLLPGARLGSALLCGPTINLAEHEGRYRPSAAVGRGGCRRAATPQAVHTRRGDRVDVHPTKRTRVGICDHMTPVSLGVSPRLSASQKLRLPAQNVQSVGEVPVGCARHVTAS